MRVMCLAPIDEEVDSDNVKGNSIFQNLLPGVLSSQSLTLMGQGLGVG